ncbi:metallophosphoesterase [Nibribacter ruber]|uniref:Metallophosphoesterase n=1 Tax=Nibribacter ruber TaxID=2698458 RepID=A0A6P1NZW1_9BACT|nr:metallophosphoesterase [Nibribacter ruber]QHL87775.1 metallophosphoesterase [Nibribacter ruber]
MPTQPSANIFKTFFKWSLLAIIGYWPVATLVFGHSSIDESKGIYTFHWSGLNALVNDEEFGFANGEEVATKLDGADGPYVFGQEQFIVTADNKIIKSQIDPRLPIKVKAANEDQDSFYVTLKTTYQPQQDQYALPAKLMAISDIEGNFDAFASFLIKHGVMDRHYNWTFGQGHLVLNGDFVDRGENEPQVLWLIYLLEDKAAAQGGQVHYILGNHEVMKLYGDYSYTEYKYREVAKQISGFSDWGTSAKFLYGPTSELGKWLKTKNVVLKMGPYLFVHAGINSNLLAHQLTVSEINQIARKYYGQDAKDKVTDPKEKTVLSKYDSPYWDRSLSMNLVYRIMYLFRDPLEANYHKTTQAELEQILAFYDVSQLVVGHSVVQDITTDYQGKVVKIDVRHGQEKNSDKTEGILIENNTVYRIDGQGHKEKL